VRIHAVVHRFDERVASRIVLPNAPQPRERHPFPVVATIAPVIVGIGMVVITGSIMSLAFAALGPVIAISSVLDGKRSTRRSMKAASEQFLRDVERADVEIAAAHDRERAQSERQNPRSVPNVQWDDPAELVVRVGTGDTPSSLRLDGAVAGLNTSADIAAELERLATTAAIVHDAPIVAEVEGSLTIVGAAALARPLFRSLVVQLAARLSPATYSIAVGAMSEEWLYALPHRVTDGDHGGVEFRRGDLVLARLDTAHHAVAISGPVIAVGAHDASAHGLQAIPQCLSVEEARAFTRDARQVAERLGIVARVDALPDVVDFAALAHGSVGLCAPLGISNHGVHEIDLIAHGPHAVVGGTTGSGKSELLVTWLLGVTAHRSPAEVTFLLFDFKGGSSFGSLPTLPHCVGLVTDLDTVAARRALESIGAELRFRERTIAESGVKSIDDLDPGSLARLIVVIDEFASVAETFPELYAVFSDLAARGRSLGVHLVLCTQRPAGVVRDAVMGNIGLRISLRVTNASDSTAVLGSDAAARLVGQPVGRACVAQIGHPVETIQVAIATDHDVAGVAQRWSSCDRPRRPWLEPLPHVVALTSIARSPGARVFGLVDDPANQSQPLAVWRPAEEGSFLVVGGTASGKSTALAAIASAGPSSWVPGDAAGAWDSIASPRVGSVLVVDDLDRLLGRCGADYEREIVDRLIALARDPDIRIAVAAQRLTGGAALVAAECEARLVLRMANKHDHVLAGGSSADFAPAIQAGAGMWRGLRAQVAREPLPQPAPVDAAPVLQVSQLTIGVSSRPDHLSSMLIDRGVQVERLEHFRPDETGARVVVADADSWQSAYAALSSLRVRCPILFHASTLADVRAIARLRELPPPLVDQSRSGWLVESGEIRRVSL
jgi:DNA segregation ATPase FtsK/SpoIIIE, S-DNA-T family